MQTAAMLWTGGKDSALALFEARQNGYRVDCLVTFAPPDRDFLAHPLGFMKMQAQALRMSHYVLPISPPFETSYETSLRDLRENGIDCVVTGDIAEVNGNRNWIRERSARVGMSVHTPLWGRDRDSLLRKLVHCGFKSHFSCVNTRWLDESWVGRPLDDDAIIQLRSIRERTGLDLCGEEGEYHTLVFDGPEFTQRIKIGSYSRWVADSLCYMALNRFELVGHTGDASPTRSPQT